jgi:hypothetical protein
MSENTIQNASTEPLNRGMMHDIRVGVGVIVMVTEQAGGRCSIIIIVIVIADSDFTSGLVRADVLSDCGFRLLPKITGTEACTTSVIPHTAIRVVVFAGTASVTTAPAQP